MKTIAFVWLFLLSVSCRFSSNKCMSHEKYLRKNIDESKPYSLKGVYCIEKVRDTITIREGCGLVKLRAFDRKNGLQIPSGVLYFLGMDTSTVIFDSRSNQFEVVAGEYLIEAWSNRYMGTRTRKIEIKSGEAIMINFFLGSKLEF